METKLLGGSRYFPLDHNDDDVQERSEGRIASKKWNDRNIPVRRSLLLSGIALQILVWICLILWIIRQPQNSQTIGYYPAATAVSYYETTFKQEAIYKTKGDLPSPETDAAWKELQAPSDGMISASPSHGFDTSRLPPTVHSVLDHSLGVYGLEVYHQLHCLDMIRKSFYPTHYFPNATAAMIIHHREHCIEHLRQSIMCSGDIALDTWYWDAGDGKSYLRTEGTPHVCKDWGKLREWVGRYAFRNEDWIRQDG